MSNSSTSAPKPGQPIPTPPDFPVIWDDPKDAKLIWSLFPLNNAPIPPLIHAGGSAFFAGFNVGFEKAALPVKMRLGRVNTYEYTGMVPTAAPPETVMKAMGLLNQAAPGAFKFLMGRMTAGMTKQQEAANNPIIGRFDAYWQDEVLPEIKSHIAYFENADLPNLSLEQWRAHLKEALQRTERMGTLHGIVLPMLFAMSQFEELYRELFEGASTLDALILTQGLDNLTMKGDRWLWDLSRQALAAPEVRRIISETPAGQVIPALEKSPASQPFLADLRAWLAEYGQRLSATFALGEPSWIEDPTPAIEYLKADLAQVEPRPGMDSISLANGREQAVAEARRKLAGYPQPVVARFEMLLKAAQTATVVHEDHNVWIDQRLFYQLHRLVVGYGQRLAQEGLLDSPADIWYLTPDELQDSQEAALKILVQNHKAEMEHFSKVTPPLMLGTMPAFEMGDGGPMVRAMMKGEMGPGNTGNLDANIVKGLAGSAGLVRGTARVIHSLAEAGKLQRGDVLVAPATEPPWTPLFATAAAIVTDSGGVLSHSAVVAREYRIPAVVGTGNATSTFHDGQLLEVDGDAGTVRVVVEAVKYEPALVG
jgi:phosphohistidine swiveling domain-containing protein